MDTNHQIKICYFGTYRETYSRNQMMIAGLRMNGVVVYECHETLWHGIEDRVSATRGGWKHPRFWVRLVRAYLSLLIKYFQIGEYDLVMVGYPGQLDIFLARILAWLKRKPLIWDVFMSIYLISIERGLDRDNRLSITLIRFLEGFALKLPDLLILDTREYVDWFCKNYKVNPSRFRLIPTGADDRIFVPLSEKSVDEGKFRVLYAGTFIPNHGVKHIIEAARVLKSEPAIEFELIGEGPELNNAIELADNYKLNNIKFIHWLTKEELIKHINSSDVCLGAFGSTPQSLMTVQNKIYEAMAMAKPLISGDSPAVRHVFNHKEQIYLCQRENGQSIAEAIVALWNDPILRNSIAQNGYKLFSDNYRLEENGLRLKQYLCELVA